MAPPSTFEIYMQSMNMSMMSTQPYPTGGAFGFSLGDIGGKQGQGRDGANTGKDVNGGHSSMNQGQGDKNGGLSSRKHH